MKIEVKPTAMYTKKVEEFKLGTAVWIPLDDEVEFLAIVTKNGYVPLENGFYMDSTWLKARPANVKIV